MLLSRFVEFECRTSEDVNRQANFHASGSTFKLRKRESSNGFLFKSHVARTRDVSLVSSRTNRDNDVTTGVNIGMGQIFQIEGKTRWRWGQTDLINDLSSGGCLVPPHTACHVHSPADVEVLSLFIEPQALRTKLSALIGEADRELQFDYAAPGDSNKMCSLQQATVRLAMEMDDAHQSAFNSAIMNEMTQSLIIRFLLSHSHNQSHRFRIPEGRLATGQVHRIETYLIDNWDKPFTIEDAVADLQISARTIFRALNKSQGCSPMTFVRNVRLDKARAMLMNGDHTTSVLSIAIRCGFQSFGHFARNYRERYGELPSNTLRQRFKTMHG